MKLKKNFFDPFYFRTISGQLILINVLVFVLMSFWDQSFLAPSQEALLFWGSANSVKIGQGEIWRFLTANFVHFGIIHIWFNATALKVIGPQIEEALGKSVFLFIYLICGLFSMMMSVYFNLSTSAGASGAIFGLIGVGIVLEIKYDRRSLKKDLNQFEQIRKKFLLIFLRRPFFAIGLLNIFLSIGLNLLTNFFDIKIKVDNAAHISGMIAGMSLFGSILLIKENKNVLSKKLSAAAILGLFLSGLCFAFYFMGNSNYLSIAHKNEGLSNSDSLMKYYHYSQALKIDPFNKEALFERGKTALLYGDFKRAIKDFQNLIQRGYTKEEFKSLIEELRKEKKEHELNLIKFILQENPEKIPNK